MELLKYKTSKQTYIAFIVITKLSAKYTRNEPHISVSRKKQKNPMLQKNKIKIFNNLNNLFHFNKASK